MLEYFDTKYCDVRCLSKLTNLRKLSGRVAPKDMVVMLKSLILNNSNCLLQYSSFWISGDFQMEEEQSLLRQLLGCHHLRQLSLWGYLNLVNKLPDQFPSNLTYLRMGNTELEEDPMPTLEKLPNLRSLILDWKSYIGKEMVCSSAPTTPSSSCRGFPQLKSLMHESIQNLEEWKVEQGAMPCLFRLVIFDCPKLKEIPNRLRFITTLRELQIQRVSEALRDRLRGGEDFCKVHHVPSIVIP
ncbi:putative disease resistance RPP8-like protein 4 [Camellia lanceoleosa]|uniref:Disease resistance RPP8-like protein 4 n=1 Tax=Camellia lanceoleosa TaxID=1840588 RepID=A0ACC0ITP7_9ERIC|nr:putative disease resistance RPP8-like protein 4 [Camellia lanceoleosa]